MAPYTYPHAIRNDGEILTILRRVPAANGDRLEGESRVSPGAGPPMHVHHLQEEGLTVLEGRLGYERAGEPPRFAGPGESVVFRAGEAHRFWNAGDRELHCSAYIEPAGNFEYFLTELFASGRRRRDGRPAAFEVAYLAHRYRGEFTMVAIPSAVRRIVFPIVVGLGRVLGRYARYADAPAPMRG